MSEKRRFIRHQSIQLLDCLIRGDDGAITTHSMGRTIDLSKTGIQLETVEPFSSGSKLELTVAINEELVDLKGKVIHCREAMGRYLSGIALEKHHGKTKQVYQRYIDALQMEKGTAAR